MSLLSTEDMRYIAGRMTPDERKKYVARQDAERTRYEIKKWAKEAIHTLRPDCSSESLAWAVEERGKC